jgi:peptidoglycan/LPS O-acetylase OafA/YrhL
MHRSGFNGAGTEAVIPIPSRKGDRVLRYRADIDGLRAIAVLLVLVFHFDLMGLGDGGFIGVDIFFVISGYLVSSIIWRELSDGSFSLRTFYLRRIRRLAPALLAVQVAVLGLAALTLLPSEALLLVKESFFVQTYLANVYYWRSLDYFGIHASSAFMLHTWSLAVEEQFYLLFPLFLIGVKRWLPHRLLLALLALTLGSFLLNLLTVEWKPQPTFYLLPTRAWEMTLGALIPFAEPWMRDRDRLRALIGPMALLLIGIALAIHGPGIPFPGWFALLPTVAACLIILAGAGRGSSLSGLLARPLPVWIGSISYPLYLVHWPLHIFATTLLPTYGPALRWAAFGLSFVLAWLIYRFVEQPVRRGPVFRPVPRLVAGYAVSVAAVLAIVASGWVSSGWRGRFSPAVLRVADESSDSDARERALDFRAEDPLEPQMRRIGRAGQVPHWLIFGDSHAGALADAFARFLDARGEAGLLAYNSGCLPVQETGGATCRTFNRAMRDYVARHREIANVVLVSIWRQPLEQGFVDHTGQVVSGADAIRGFNTGLRATLTSYERTGVRMIIWEPLPAMPHSVPEAMSRNMLFGNYWPTSRPRSEHLATFTFLRDALSQNASLIAARVQPDRVLCAKGACPGSIDGLPIYVDNNHPTLRTSTLYATILHDQLGTMPRAEARP